MIFSSLLLVIIFLMRPHFLSLLFWLSWDFLFSVFSRINSSALNTRSAVGRQQWAWSWPDVYQHLARRWTATINGYWLLCAGQVHNDSRLHYHVTSHQGHAVSDVTNPPAGLVFSPFSVQFPSHSGVRALSYRTGLIRSFIFCRIYFVLVLCLVFWWRMMQVLIAFPLLSC